MFHTSDHSQCIPSVLEFLTPPRRLLHWLSSRRRPRLWRRFADAKHGRFRVLVAIDKLPAFISLSHAQQLGRLLLVDDDGLDSVASQYLLPAWPHVEHAKVIIPNLGRRSVHVARDKWHNPRRTVLDQPIAPPHRVEDLSVRRICPHIFGQLQRRFRA